MWQPRHGRAVAAHYDCPSPGGHNRPARAQSVALRLCPPWTRPAIRPTPADSVSVSRSKLAPESDQMRFLFGGLHPWPQDNLHGVLSLILNWQASPDGHCSAIAERRDPLSLPWLWNLRGRRSSFKRAMVVSVGTPQLSRQEDLSQSAKGPEWLGGTVTQRRAPWVLER